MNNRQSDRLKSEDRVMVEAVLWDYFIGHVFLHINKRQWAMLVAHFGSKAQIDWQWVFQHCHAFGIRMECSQSYAKAKAAFEDFKQQIDRMGTQILLPKLRDFPASLRLIAESPKVLFCLGEHTLLNKKKLVSIVGTRQPSAYGLRVAYDLAAFLARHDVGVVSGLASGIDTAAHKGALSEKGFTAAVVATGVHNVYPKANRTLYHAILESGGTMISEKPLVENARRYDFPYRNRLISGLAQATVVIEASHKSGSLITAKYAAEQGRDVFALPGNIYADVSKGTNQLIFDGAVPLVDFGDILTALDLKTIPNSSEVSLAHLSETEKQVLHYLKKYNIIEIEQLRTLANLDVQTMHAVVARLLLEDFCTYASLTSLQCLI
ncbi:DNA-processing protein DprA [Fusibacter paucivorans]|uniref:DNA-processing protein DprA n=1 Tax=Fusibacter paucivorans TaxID=76009 RepID=A0ABS5PTH1_9FIRM|nr:DNA-processing protein DprA [Fusibacter paucivorans]MBS7528386.1 DNA-processing protein DprA [Fusibacter paucivorans]